MTRDWREELRCLEYGQRLLRRQRNVSAESRAPGLVGRSSAARLWQRVQMGSAAAAGEATWGLVAGARADALIPDAQDPALVGVPISRLLDALVYSSPTRPWAEVMVAGHWVVRDGRHPRARRIAQEFSQAMATLSAAD